ncbi:MAG: NAD-dependent deacylase [Bacteroidaceae bacterium]|nr:NAD-dependent deacylase [Bacteroidaceae bacterium]MCF0186752.1 NAD-dependent deacylase [Bacteroidaceae bacterium]
MKKIVFLTGAGISAESGISTFRDSGGLWDKYNVQDVASIEGYWRNRELVLDFYNVRRHESVNTKPNKAHLLVAELEKHFDVTVVTQNVDNLHEQAGSSHIIHLHGELMKATSERNPNDPRCIVQLGEDNLDIHLGDKAKDGSQLRPFIVWFGESVPMIEYAVEEVEQADILVVVGSSLNVYPAAGLVHYAPINTPIYVIDPKPVEVHTNREITFIQKKASEGMEELTALLLK